MKKLMTLMMVLLLLFALTLTGCGGGGEEAEVSEEPAVEEELSTPQDDLVAKYNEFAELFNTLDPAFEENGLYETNEELKTNMDKAFELLGMYAELIESDLLTDDEKVELMGEIQMNIDSLNAAGEANL
ncbi:MAG: hypothetical protein EOM59_00835 [Clostridia bacterium]|nr:hypothetical protein [Clostridia bacterium]